MRQLIFSIDRLEYRGGGNALVAGRCCGDPIKSGDFAKLMVNRKEDGTFSQSEVVSVSFTGFELYGKTVNTIERNYSAGILVSNDSATGLRLGWYLIGENA